MLCAKVKQYLEKAGLSQGRPQGTGSVWDSPGEAGKGLRDEAMLLLGFLGDIPRCASGTRRGLAS